MSTSITPPGNTPTIPDDDNPILETTPKINYSVSKDGLVTITCTITDATGKTNVINFDKLNEIIPPSFLTVGFGSDQMLIEIMKELLRVFTSIAANRQLSANIDLENFVQAALAKQASSLNEAEKRRDSAMIRAVIQIVASVVEVGVSAATAYSSAKQAGALNKKSADLDANANTTKVEGGDNTGGQASPRTKDDIANKKDLIDTEAATSMQNALTTQHRYTAALKFIDAFVKCASFYTAQLDYEADMEKIKADFAATVMNIFSQGENMNNQAVDKIKEMLASVIQFLAELIRNMSQTEKSIGTGV